MGEIIEKGIRQLRPLDAGGRRIRTEEDDIPVSSGTSGFEEDEDATSLSRREIRVKEEYLSEDEEDDETKKALNTIAQSIAIKYFGNIPRTAGFAKEFNDILSQVFQSHAGSENLTNLRLPGQPPAKIPAKPGNSGRNRTGSYRTEDDPENPNPSELGTGYIHGNAKEVYGRVTPQGGSGVRTTWDSKPRGDYSIPAGFTGSGANRDLGQRVLSHPRTISDVPLGTYGTSTHLESVQLPSSLPPMKKSIEIEKATVSSMIKQLTKAVFDQEESEEEALERYSYGQVQPSRNEEEEELMRRRMEEEGRKEQFRELESEAAKYEQLAQRPMMEEDERESYTKTAMELHAKASAVLKGVGPSRYGEMIAKESTRKVPVPGGYLGFNPSEFARKTKVAGSRGAVTK